MSPLCRRISAIQRGKDSINNFKSGWTWPAGGSLGKQALKIDPAQLRQSWPKPSTPRPIAIIGAGGIVNDAHLPAYRKAGFSVAGVFDIDPAKANALAAKWDVKVFGSMEEVAAAEGVIFDVATPPAAHCRVLENLPAGSTVLIQKPMGRDLNEAMPS